MSHESDPAAAARVAALWRRVRWGAVGFCVVQFAVYLPSPGAGEAPVPLLPVGVLLAALVAAVNMAAATVERRRPRRPGPARQPARRDLFLLAADLAAVVAVVELFAFDPTAAVWALLMVPVLEAGLIGRLWWALSTWGVCVAALAGAQLLAVATGGQPAPTVAGLVSLLGYRSGVLLLVALVVGVQANAAFAHVEQLHAVRRQLEHEATHDHLTGVAARALFLDRARRALRSGDRDGRLTGVLYVDCDDFKAVNDTFGHEAGDRVLVEVACRLTAGVRPGDTVARLGGDEFAVLLERLDDVAELYHIAERVRAALSQSYPMPDDHPALVLTCSVGVGVGTGEDWLPALLRAADADMYRHKATR